jgi:hypothetical protein
VGFDAGEGKVWPEPPPDDHLHVLLVYRVEWAARVFCVSGSFSPLVLG